MGFSRSDQLLTFTHTLSLLFISFNYHIVVRLQAYWPSGKPRYASIADACKSIYVEEGIPGLYRGVVPTATRAMVVTASQLASYDTTKHWLLKQRDQNGEALFREGYLTHFCASTVAGKVSSALDDNNLPPLSLSDIKSQSGSNRTSFFFYLFHRTGMLHLNISHRHCQGPVHEPAIQCQWEGSIVQFSIGLRDQNCAE